MKYIIISILFIHFSFGQDTIIEDLRGSENPDLKSDNIKVEVPRDGNTTIEVPYIKQYYIKASVFENRGKGKLSWYEGWVKENDKVSITAEALDGYSFVKWQGDIDDANINDNTIEVSANKARSIEAVFSDNQAKLSFSPNYGNSSQEKLYDVGSEVSWTLTSPHVIDENTRFVTTKTSGNIVLNEDTLIEIPWQKQIKIKINSDKELTDIVQFVWHNVGEETNIHAKGKEERYKFVKWIGVDEEFATQNPLKIKVDKTLTIKPVFVKDKFKFTLVSPTGKVLQEKLYKPNEVANWKFEKEIIDGGVKYINDNASGSVVMNKDIILQIKGTKEFKVERLQLIDDKPQELHPVTWFQDGQMLTIAADETKTRVFSHWEGDVPTGKAKENPLKIKVAKPISIIAKYYPTSITTITSNEENFKNQVQQGISDKKNDDFSISKYLVDEKNKGERKVIDIDSLSKITKVIEVKDWIDNNKGQVEIKQISYKKWQALLMRSSRLEIIIVPRLSRMVYFGLPNGEKNLLKDNTEKYDVVKPEDKADDWADMGGQFTWIAPTSLRSKFLDKKWPPAYEADGDALAKIEIKDNKIITYSKMVNNYNCVIKKTYAIKVNKLYIQSELISKGEDVNLPMSVKLLTQFDRPDKVFLGYNVNPKKTSYGIVPLQGSFYDTSYEPILEDTRIKGKNDVLYSNEKEDKLFQFDLKDQSKSTWKVGNYTSYLSLNWGETFLQIKVENLNEKYFFPQNNTNIQLYSSSKSDFLELSIIGEMEYLKKKNSVLQTVFSLN